MIRFHTSNIEQRLFKIAVCLTAAGALLAGVLYGLGAGLSLMAGGTLAALNLAWLRHAVNAAFARVPRRSTFHILAGFFLRLLLIPVTLYAMIRFLFTSIPAAVAGFALFNCAIFVEGILEAFGRSSKEKNARTERSR